MLAEAVQSYLAVRRATGFDLKLQGNFLKSFTTFSEAKGKDYICSETAIEWGWIGTIGVATFSPTWCSHPIRSIHPNGGPASPGSTSCVWYRKPLPACALYLFQGRDSAPARSSIRFGASGFFPWTYVQYVFRPAGVYGASRVGSNPAPL